MKYCGCEKKIEVELMCLHEEFIFVSCSLRFIPNFPHACSWGWMLNWKMLKSLVQFWSEVKWILWLCLRKSDFWEMQTSLCLPSWWSLINFRISLERPVVFVDFCPEVWLPYFDASGELENRKSNCWKIRIFWFLHSLLSFEVGKNSAMVLDVLSVWYKWLSWGKPSCWELGWVPVGW